MVYHDIFFANIKAFSFLHKIHQSRRSRYWLWINKILVSLLHHDNYGNSIPNDWTKRYSVNPKVFLTLVLALDTKTLSLILLASAFLQKVSVFLAKKGPLVKVIVWELCYRFFSFLVSFCKVIKGYCNKRGLFWFMWFRLIRCALVSIIFTNNFYLFNHLIIAFKFEFLYYWIELIVGIILI